MLVGVERREAWRPTSAAAVGGDSAESTFLIATETDGGADFVMLLEHGRLVHAGEGWEAVVPAAV